MIPGTYLQPVTLSQELQSYMDEVLAGADSDYEKLLRMETMLHSFGYTDTPGALPEDIDGASDFLDYLILEKQSGYCSYYATAFVLLARAYGFPARYVQGYHVPSGVISNKKATVLSSYAHAWPEVYLEGVGWFGFEPTPGTQRYVRWTTTTERRNDRKGDGSAPTEYTAPASVSQNTLSEEKDSAETAHFILHWYHIIIPVSAGLLLVLLLLVIDHLLRRIRYRRMDAREKGLWLCRRNMDALKRMKLIRKESETIEEYSRRAGEQCGSDATAFCGIYEALLYGGKEPTEDELKLLAENIKRLQKRYREQKKKKQEGKSPL